MNSQKARILNHLAWLLALAILLAPDVDAQRKIKGDEAMNSPLKSRTFSGLKW